MQKDLAADNFVSKWPSVIRWVLVLPTAAIAAVLASMLYLFGFNLFIAGEPGFLPKLMSSAILGGVFVYAGAWMSPRYQFVTSIALLVIITLFSVFSVAGSFLPNSSVGPVLGIIHAIVVLMAAGAVVVGLHEEYR